MSDPLKSTPLSLWQRLIRRLRPVTDEPRRLTVDDVTVVDRPMLRRAVAGTVVGNLMEWYDIGVYLSLIHISEPTRPY